MDVHVRFTTPGAPPLHWGPPRSLRSHKGLPDSYSRVQKFKTQFVGPRSGGPKGHQGFTRISVGPSSSSNGSEVVLRLTESTPPVLLPGVYTGTGSETLDPDTMEYTVFPEINTLPYFREVYLTSGPNTYLGPYQYRISTPSNVLPVPSSLSLFYPLTTTFMSHLCTRDVHPFLGVRFRRSSTCSVPVSKRGTSESPRLGRVWY